MSAPQKLRSPAGTGLRNYELLSGSKYTTRFPQLPRNWRDRLPEPAAYYVRHVEKLSKPNVTGWAQGRCPFHDDSNASLSVNVGDARGGWRCFASCGGGVQSTTRRTPAFNATSRKCVIAAAYRCVPLSSVGRLPPSFMP